MISRTSDRRTANQTNGTRRPPTNLTPYTAIASDLPIYTCLAPLWNELFMFMRRQFPVQKRTNPVNDPGIMHTCGGFQYLAASRRRFLVEVVGSCSLLFSPSCHSCECNHPRESE